MHAHKNAVENLVVFAPLVLMISVLDAGTAATAIACKTYFFSRAAHFVVYTMGLPLLRTVAFIIGFAFQIVLATSLLGVQ